VTLVFQSLKISLKRTDLSWPARYEPTSVGHFPSLAKPPSWLKIQESWLSLPKFRATETFNIPNLSYIAMKLNKLPFNQFTSFFLRTWWFVYSVGAGCPVEHRPTNVVRYVFQPLPVIYASFNLLCPRRLRRCWLATHIVKNTKLCSRIFRLYG
jgi:hypothetical protein